MDSDRPKEVGPSIMVVSLVSQRDGSPRVDITMERPRIQLSYEETIAFARNLTAAAEAAMSDSFIVQFLQQKADLTNEQAVQLLQDFREFRDSLTYPGS